MLKAFSFACIKEQTSVKFEAGGDNIFSVKGYVIKLLRWKTINGTSDEGKEDQTMLQFIENEE